jgi:hypothetical protein
VKDKNRSLVNATLVIRLLYDLAVDSYDRAQTLPVCCSADGKILPRSKSSDDPTCALRRPVNLNPISVNPDPILVHPGVILAMFQLLPSIWTEENPEASRSLQLLVTDIIQSLTHSERNVQILCDAGFPSEILKYASSVLNNESRHLHGPLLTVLEQLVRQALEPKDLRAFLRMGDPLNCLLPELSDPKTVHSKGAPLPLFRLKSLVSMSTPKDVGRSGNQGVALYLRRSSNSTCNPKVLDAFFSLRWRHSVNTVVSVRDPVVEVVEEQDKVPPDKTVLPVN